MIRYTLIFFLCVIFFTWGYFSNRNLIFPYPIINFVKNFLFIEKNEKNLYELEIINIEDDKIRNKYKNWDDLNPNYIITKKKYFPGLNIFSDRNYINHKNDEKLNGFSLIQIPRHYDRDIFIEIFKDIYLYRITCKKNNNKKYKGFEILDFKVAIVGGSCVHTDVIKKKYKKGLTKIQIGGPISADPIFVEEIFENEIGFKIHEKNYF